MALTESQKRYSAACKTAASAKKKLAEADAAKLQAVIGMTTEIMTKTLNNNGMKDFLRCMSLCFAKKVDEISLAKREDVDQLLVFLNKPAEEQPNTELPMIEIFRFRFCHRNGEQKETLLLQGLVQQRAPLRMHVSINSSPEQFTEVMPTFKAEVVDWIVRIAQISGKTQPENVKTLDNFSERQLIHIHQQLLSNIFHFLLVFLQELRDDAKHYITSSELQAFMGPLCGLEHFAKDIYIFYEEFLKLSVQQEEEEDYEDEDQDEE